MIKTNIKLKVGYTEADLIDALCQVLPIDRCEVRDVGVLKRSLNLTDKGDIHYDLTVAASFSPEREMGLLKMKKKVKPHDPLSLSIPQSRLKSRPVVVGFGPAGLFSALLLAHAGARPIVYERGRSVEERTKKVELFNALSILDTECNVQYGEGGAGTFSDGKLKVGAMDAYKKWILEKLIEFGAPPDVLFSTTAHVGTDKLSLIVKKIREEIISLGGEVIFGARLSEIIVKDGKLVGGRVERDGGFEDFFTDCLVLAAGHSALDTFELLRTAGATLTPRPFGIGLRIEHKREYTDSLVYGKNPPEGIETASYHLVTHLDNGRSVYSFCMCPGGTVVGAASDAGGIVTNGMSEYGRNGENSNAAFLVSVTPEDFPTTDPLSGIALQRSIEKGAFALTDSYRAPCVRMEDFLYKNKPTRLGEIKPTYPLGTELFAPEAYLPDYITDSLRAAITDFDDWMKGFYHPDATMTGPETRSTSPVRVQRGEDYAALGIEGLYPVGEGAGYSGGIISSARDGVAVAYFLLENA